MKTHLKHLLVLALMVLIFGGCQNPSGPETPEVIEPPVVEVPEDDVKLFKVEFKWSTNPDTASANPGIGGVGSQRFDRYAPIYLLDLHWDTDSSSYIYSIPENYTSSSYNELTSQEEFKKFSEDAFKEAFSTFSTQSYKEGDEIDLTQWTSKARFSINGKISNNYYDCLRFSLESVTENGDVKNPFSKIKLSDKDLIIYVFFESNSLNKYK